MLRERLPRGHVIALDGSRVDGRAGARERLGDDRVEYVVADLQAPLPDRPAGRRDPVDGHVPLDRRPRRAVREPGGGVAPGRTAGGPMRRRRQHRVDRGRARRDRRGASRGGSTSRRPTRPGAGWSAAGFIDVETWLTRRADRARPDDVEPYLETICLGDHVEGMDPATSVARSRTRWRSGCPDRRIDYVRLNIRARVARLIAGAGYHRAARSTISPASALAADHRARPSIGTATGPRTTPTAATTTANASTRDHTGRTTSNRRAMRSTRTCVEQRRAPRTSRRGSRSRPPRPR